MALKRCWGCGYNREGLSTPVCPECGEAWEKAALAAAKRQRWRRAAGAMVVGAIGLVVLQNWQGVRERGRFALVPTWVLIEVVEADPTAWMCGPVEYFPSSYMELRYRNREHGFNSWESRRLGMRLAEVTQRRHEKIPELAGETTQYMDLQALIDARGEAATALSVGDGGRSWAAPRADDANWTEWARQVTSAPNVCSGIWNSTARNASSSA